jgi:isopropylmalate/homocitrate/citramalate synthase
MQKIDIKSPLRILDTTLRDGEQTAGVSFDINAKVEIAKALDEIGVHDIDAGFAAVSESERKALKKISELNLRANVMSLSRALPSDVDAAAEAGIRYVGIFIALSDLHLEKKLQINEDQAFDMVAETIKHAKSRNIMVRFGAEDASRAPITRLLRFYEMASDLGAKTLGYADTCGVDTPDSIFENLSKIKAAFSDSVLSVHCHNDLGLSVINSIAAVKAGAQQIHVCVNGLGERAGNTPMEEFLMSMLIGYNVDIGLKIEKISNLSDLVYKHSKLDRPFNKPIVGKFVFSHESGIHAHGILSDARTYEPFPPAMVGRSHEIVLGKHSGVKNLEYWLTMHFPDLVISQEDKMSILLSIKKLAESEGLIGVDQLRKILISHGKVH